MRHTCGSFLIPVLLAFVHSAVMSADEPKYTIDNAVNTFKKEDTVKTKVGYQYWFADKKFADGKTLKLSVVNPGEATHAPRDTPTASG